MKPWCSFAVSAYHCCLTSKTKPHSTTWQNLPISSSLPRFVSLSCLFSPWKSQGLAELKSFASLVSKQCVVISLFSRSPMEQSMHAHLTIAAVFILTVSAWLTTVTITVVFFNKTWDIHLTSSLQNKACKQTGWYLFCHGFPPQTQTQMEIIAQSLGFRISQREQNILLQFS